MIQLSFQFSEEIIKIHWSEFYFLRKKNSFKTEQCLGIWHPDDDLKTNEYLQILGHISNELFWIGNDSSMIAISNQV